MHNQRFNFFTFDWKNKGIICGTDKMKVIKDRGFQPSIFLFGSVNNT